MKIALDFDDTYTVDPDLWDLFITSAITRGHSVTLVTYRYEPDEGTSFHNDDVKKIAELHGIDIVFTHGMQKAGVFNADVWIDDCPVTIPVSQELLNMHEGCLVNGDTKKDCKNS